MGSGILNACTVFERVTAFKHGTKRLADRGKTHASDNLTRQV